MLQYSQGPYSEKKGHYSKEYSQGPYSKEYSQDRKMKNFTIIGIVAAVLFLGIGVFTLSQKPQMKPDSVMEEKSQPTSTSRYVEYSKAILDQATQKRRVLYFYANWCPTCRPADKNFKENADKIPEDAILIRVNYNDTDTDQEEKDLAKKYGVTYQHTFVQIDSQGSEITKWNGGQIEELLANLK